MKNCFLNSDIFFNMNFFFPEIFPSLVAEIKLKRTFTYHLFSGYLPSSFLVVLTWATFWIPPRAVPARVTIIVTNFLSTIFVIQQEVGKIIRVDYITAVQVLLITNLVFILLAMVEYLIVLNVKDRTKVSINTFNNQALCLMQVRLV